MEDVGSKKQPQRLEKPVRITEQVWPEGTEPTVTIVSWVYNHEKFLREAIEGFLMQETTFPVEIILHDDASTDCSVDIIREYEREHPKLFRNILRPTNMWQRGINVAPEVYRIARGEFVALCEGDDFWTSPNKLQLQYTYFLEHREVDLVCTRYAVLDQQSNLSRCSLFDNQSENHLFVVSKSNWFDPYVLMTCTAVFRNKPLQHAFSKLTSLKGVKDIFVWRLLLENSDAVVLPYYTAVYRKHAGGCFSLLDEATMHLHNMHTALEMLNHFGPRCKDIRIYLKICADLYTDSTTKGAKWWKCVTVANYIKLVMCWGYAKAYYRYMIRLIDPKCLHASR